MIIHSENFGFFVFLLSPDGSGLSLKKSKGSCSFGSLLFLVSFGFIATAASFHTCLGFVQNSQREHCLPYSLLDNILKKKDIDKLFLTFSGGKGCGIFRKHRLSAALFYAERKQKYVLPIRPKEAHPPQQSGNEDH